MLILLVKCTHPERCLVGSGDLTVVLPVMNKGCQYRTRKCGTNNAGVEMQDWKMRDRNSRGGKCRTGKCGTKFNIEINTLIFVPKTASNANLYLQNVPQVYLDGILQTMGHSSFFHATDLHTQLLKMLMQF